VGRVSSRGGLGGEDDDAAMGNRRSGSNDAADLVVQHQGVVDTSQGDADPGCRQTGTARAGHVVGPDLVVRDAVVARWQVAGGALTCRSGAHEGG